MEPREPPSSYPVRAGEALAVISAHTSPLAELGRGESGGMNLAVRRLCEQLSTRGVPSDVFVRRDDPWAPAERLIAPGSRQVLIDAGPPRPLPKGEVLHHLPTFTAGLLEHAASERRSYRLIHSHYWLSGFVASRAASRWRVPWVHSAHTLARLKAAAGLPLDAPRAEVEAVLVRGADRLVAVSSAEAAALSELYDADPGRVCVVPPGVDPAAFVPRRRDPLRSRHGLTGRRSILYAGRLERLKGLDLLLDALAEIAAAPGHADVVLLCAGENSEDGDRQAGHPAGERGRLAARAAELGLAERVRFLGAVEPAELADLMAAADVVAVPSMTETFGLVALEAQAAGTPVVASAVGGLADTVIDGVTGRLVGGRRPADFAAALLGILDADGLRARMGEAAREHAATLTWERSADRLLTVYACVDRPAPVSVGATELCACL